MEQQYTREKLLTTPAELQKKLGSPDLCLIDVRPAEQFAQGHIPGAVHFDLFGLSLVDTTEAPLRAFMHMIHHVLELRGVSDAKEVIFYEGNSGMRAARGLWFLEYFGHPNARMLDGGIDAWKAAGGTITMESVVPKAATFKTTERPGGSGYGGRCSSAHSTRKNSPSWTRAAEASISAHMCGRRAAGLFPGPFTLNGPTILTLFGKFKSNAELKACTIKPASCRTKK